MTLELRVPGDKSIAHRAVLFGLLARGDSRFDGVPASDDVEATIAAARALGGDVVRSGEAVLVRGRGVEALRAPARALDCANSGTTARLCMGLAAALDGRTALDGDASLRRRPMARVARPLEEAGASVEYIAAQGRLPLQVSGGRLGAIRHVSPVPSAQVKSALLLAAVAAGVEARLEEPMRSRDHTERLLRAMGVALHASADGRELELETGARESLAPVRLALPGDFSSAAFLIAAALLAGTPLIVRGVGLNPTRTGFLDIVRSMGAEVRVADEGLRGGEPVGDVHVAPSELDGIAVDGELIVRALDELPLVAVLGARARGETRVGGAGELRAKESDRIRALCANLDALGLRVVERADGFTVQGSDGPLRGRADGHGDHRIAMAFAVLGIEAGARVDVAGLELARVSYPGFTRDLERIREAAGVSIGGGGNA